jgi:Protein of unknown function (DUF2510)
MRSQAPAKWYFDPGGEHAWRYWDGSHWTEHVADDGVASAAPLAMSEAPEPPGRQFTFGRCRLVAWRTAPKWAGPGFLIAFLNSVQWWMNDDIPGDLLEAAESGDWRNAVQRLPDPWNRPREAEHLEGKS